MSWFTSSIRTFAPAAARSALVASVVVVLLAVVATPPPAGAVEEVVYAEPVDALIADGFRAPSSPYGPGNRGVDYATVPGTVVHAAAAGVVAFAGQVAGSLHVSLVHADGLRTTYAFLRSVSVRRNDRVAAGAEVGRAGSSLHWSARAGHAYLDPLALLAASSAAPRRARLVPDDEGAPLPSRGRAPTSPSPSRSWASGARHAPARSRTFAAPWLDWWRTVAPPWPPPW